MSEIDSSKVRLALPQEAAAIAQLQHSQLLADEKLAAAAGQLDVEAMSAAWYKAISAPPLATYRVLVAVSGEQVVGFAAIGPSEDPDADEGDCVVTEFRVGEGDTEDGTPDRLLHAVIDTLRMDGFERATWWVQSTDDELRSWLTETGWVPDGAHEEIGDEHGNHVRLIRMHTLLS